MKSKLILFFLLLLSYFVSTAQDTDRLMHQIHLEKNDSIKAIKYLELSSLLLRSQPDSAEAYTLKANTIGLRIKDNTILAKSYNSLGLIYKIRNQWNKSIKVFDKGLSLTKDEKLIAKLSSNKALVLYQKGDWKSALQLIQRLKPTHKNILSARNTNLMAIIFYEQKRYDEALKYFKQSYEISKKLQDSVGIAATINNISSIFIQKNVIDSAAYYTHLAVDQMKTNQDKKGLAKAYNNLAIIATRQNNHELALHHYLKAYQLQQEIGIKSIFLLENIADLYLAEFHNIREAEKFLLEAKDYAEEVGNQHNLISIYEELADINTQKKNYKLAHSYLKKRIQLSDSLYTITRDEKIIEIQEKYEHEKKDKDIAIHKANLHQKAFELKRKNYLIIILLLAISSLVTFFLFYKQKTKQKFQQMEMEIQKYIHQLKEQSIVEKQPTSPIDYKSKYNLSQREIEVLNLLSEGNSYAKVGEKLFISTNTVKFHIKNIYQKLDVKNKIEALNKIK